METFSLLEILSAPLGGQMFAQGVFDLFVKSSIIIGLTFAIAQLFRSVLSNNGAHLLWLNCLFCIAVLPFAGNGISQLTSSLVGQEAITIITVQTGVTESTGASSVTASLVFSGVYLVVTLGFLFRLLHSAIGLRRISNSARSVFTGEIAKQLASTSEKLGLKRNVLLNLSDDVSSPMSFGLLRPIVVLPTVATNWTRSTLEDVFLHELSHIKRLDWPTMLFCHLLSSLFWINPLIWFAKRRVNEAAEKVCDSAIMTHGKDGPSYAEDLLQFAKLNRGKQAPILAQLMFDESGLSIRIRNILDGNLSRKINKAFMSAMLGYAVVSVMLFSNIHVFGAGDEKQYQEYLPISAPIPLYPTQAAQDGIEGWILLSFTVTEDGSVDANSMQVMDAEPADIFDRSALRAAEKFMFQPRIIDGNAVEVPGVRYLFRYVLEDGGNLDDLSRQPPAPR